MYQLGGDTLTLGGAVMAQLFPVHVTWGKIIRFPIKLPWVLEEAATSETLMSAVDPWKRLTVI
jgi:hypothetical protein